MEFGTKECSISDRKGYDLALKVLSSRWGHLGSFWVKLFRVQASIHLGNFQWAKNNPLSQSLKPDMDDLGLTQTRHFSVVSLFSKFPFYLKYSENGLKKVRQEGWNLQQVHSLRQKPKIFNKFISSRSINSKSCFIHKSHEKWPLFSFYT